MHHKIYIIQNEGKVCGQRMTYLYKRFKSSISNLNPLYVSLLLIALHLLISLHKMLVPTHETGLKIKQIWKQVEQATQ